MVPPPSNRLNCTKYKQDSTLCQQEAENATNAYGLNLIRLKKVSFRHQEPAVRINLYLSTKSSVVIIQSEHLNFSLRCLECRAIPEATCDGRHSILDRIEDGKAIMALLTDVAGNWSEAIEKRQLLK